MHTDSPVPVGGIHKRLFIARYVLFQVHTDSLIPVGGIHKRLFIARCVLFQVHTDSLLNCLNDNVLLHSSLYLGLGVLGE